jgi:hypothetical protein
LTAFQVVAVLAIRFELAQFLRAIVSLKERLSEVQEAPGEKIECLTCFSDFVLEGIALVVLLKPEREGKERLQTLLDVTVSTTVSGFLSDEAS